MNTIIKENIKRYWSKSAKDYDTHFGHGINNSTEKKIWFDLLKNNISFPAKADILDVGCGTGFLSLLLTEMDHQVTGIDLSDDMLKMACNKAVKQNLNISFQKGDAENPNFNPVTFDVIISRHVLWTLPNPNLAVKNWFHLLKPGGIVIIIDGIWTPQNLLDHISDFFSNIIRIVKGNLRHLSWKKEYIKNSNDLPYFGGAHPKNVELLLTSNGFSDIWLDNMTQILNYERNHAPIEYKLRTLKKDRRYLIGGKKK